MRELSSTTADVTATPFQSLTGELCDSSDTNVKRWLLRQTPSPIPALTKLCNVESKDTSLSDLEAALCVKVKPLDEGHVGAMGDTTRLEVWFNLDTLLPVATTNSGRTKSRVQEFILKAVAKDRLGTSLQHGLTREVELYKRVMADGNSGHSDKNVEGVDSIFLQSVAPTVIACEADMTTGAKRVVLQDLSKEMFESGAVIGKKHTPLNFNKDVDAILQSRYPCSNPPPQEEMVVEAFLVAARLHKAHWNQKKLLQHAWLRNADIYQAALGTNETNSPPSRFEQTMQYLRHEWTHNIRPSMILQDNGDLIDSDDGGLCFSKRVVELLDMATSHERVQWKYHRSKMAKGNFTMIHGDFHPGNLMISTETNTITLLDFEMVGVGMGPQDCAQLVMSHLPPDCFGHAAEVALSAYYRELTSGSNGVDAATYTFDQCLGEYTDEGLGKWLWFLIILKNVMPPPMISYFAAQVDAFATHHERDASNWMGTLNF